LRLLRRREHSELSEESRDVHDDPALDEDAVAIAVDRPGLDFDGTAGRGDAEELALVGAGPGGVSKDAVVLGDRVVQRPVTRAARDV
jgi:hypothetical protein